MDLQNHPASCASGIAGIINEKHYTNHKWPTRKSFNVGENNVIATLLVDPKKLLIPLLHVKLGVMKRFVKALEKDGP